MRKLAFLAALALAGCGSTATVTVPATASSTSAMTTAQTIVQDGQLVCQIGAVAMAVMDATGKPVLAKGATAQYVSDVCATLNGVAVSPPVNGVAGTVAVTVPAAAPAS